MERTEFAKLRILLLSQKTHSAQTLRSVLSIAGVGKVVGVEESRRAIELLSMEHYDAVFAEESSEKVGDRPFALAVRRKRGVLNPMIPIFIFQEQARRVHVEQARDLGASDYLTCPISPKTVMTKLTAALMTPRPFIKAPEFFGPDRRAVVRPPFQGQERRARAPRKVQIPKNGPVDPAPV